MLRRFSLLLLVTVFSTASFAETKIDFDDETEVVEISSLTSDSTIAQIVSALNVKRKAAGLEEFEFNDMLAEAAMLQTEEMAYVGKASLANSRGKHKTTGKRVKAVGGTEKAKELVISFAAKKSKKDLTPEQLVAAIIKKWKGKKERAIILDANLVYASPSVQLDEAGKKIFISVVFGSFDSFNKGAGKKKRKSLKPAKYTKKNKKITAGTAKACKSCKKFKDYDVLYDGIYMVDKEVYLKYDNLKMFFKLISKPTDGLAIDIVQKAQYANPDYNILDNNLLSKGMLSKTVIKSSFKELNRAELQEGQRKLTTLDILLGKVHKKLDGDFEEGDFEINLLIIKDGSVCKTLTKSYVEQGDLSSNTKLEMLLMPDSAAYFKPRFIPTSDSSKLSFIVPFEKNKSEYKKEDILPFLNSLEEPDFIINKLDIIAYSSIEGDSVKNVKLQEKRSTNIIAAMKSLQRDGAVTSIKTSDSWEMFKESITGTQYDTLRTLPKHVVNEMMNVGGLADSLEPYLSKQRFAEIHMEVTYDIAGAKEESFSLTKFNLALKKGDIELALKIQYYISEKVKEGVYPASIYDQMTIEPSAKTSRVINNQIIMHYMLHGDIPSKEHYQALGDIVKIDPSNKYATFNYVFCALIYEEKMGTSAAVRADLQGKIDGLYSSTIPKKMIDALNIEWQFKTIEAVDTIEGSAPIILACNEKVKSFYDLKDATWENSLKLSYVFARFKDYKYASTLLRPFLENEKPNEELLFAYASYCAQIPELMKTKAFVTAMRKAEKTNHDRYCKLFGAPFLSFQVLDNPMVKAHFAEVGCGLD